MKIRYLNEGFFKNPEQARAARQKELERSSQQEIADTYNRLVSEKIQAVIESAIKKKGLYPFQLNMFSYGPHNMPLKVSKKEVICKIDTSEDTPVIHLFIDYGCFVPERKNAAPCNEVNVNSWAVKDYYACEHMSKNNSYPVLTGKIKGYAYKALKSLGDSAKYAADILRKSDIVIDKISMYSGLGAGDKVTFKIYNVNECWGMRNLLSKEIRTRFIKSMNEKELESFGYYMTALNGLISSVSFGVPVEVEASVSTFSTGLEMLPINDVFNGCDTLGDLEKAAGVDGIVWDCMKEYLTDKHLEDEDVYYSESYGRTSKYSLTHVTEEDIKNCRYICFDYTDTYIGTYHDGEGFKFNYAKPPIIDELIFGDFFQKSNCTLRIDMTCITDGKFGGKYVNPERKAIRIYVGTRVVIDDMLRKTFPGLNVNKNIPKASSGFKDVEKMFTYTEDTLGLAIENKS